MHLVMLKNIDTHREKGVHAEELDGEMHRVVAQREAVLILEGREREYGNFSASHLTSSTPAREEISAFGTRE